MRTREPSQFFENLRTYSAKYCASRCVYRSHLDDEDNLDSVKIEDILSELSKLFDNIIDNVKEQCSLDRPAEN